MWGSLDRRVVLQEKVIPQFPKVTTSISETPIIVLLATTRIFGEGLIGLLRHEGLYVLLLTTREESVVELAALRPNLVLLDMSKRESLKLAQQIRSAAPHVRLIAISVPETDDVIIECASAGIHGYLSDDASVDDLTRAMETVLAGEIHCPPRIASALLRAMNRIHSGRTTGLRPLTRRELEITNCVREGLTNKEIARRFNLQVPTVKNHVHNVLRKLKARRRTDAAALAQLAFNSPFWQRQVSSQDEPVSPPALPS